MTNQWPLGDSPVRAIPINYSFTEAGTGAWKSLSASGCEYRELGLSGATNGLMGVGHIRNASGAHRLSFAGANFLQLFVLKGSAEVREAGGAQTLGRYDAVYAGPDATLVLDMSADFEALVFSSPDILKAHVPATAAASQGAIHFNFERPESYTAGDGPRDFFKYRNLGLAKLTERRIHMHIIRAIKQRPGGTGWHTHSMSQWFMVLEGTGRITIEGSGDAWLQAGDAMSLGARIRHDMPAYSDDYVEIELCIPADYDTVPVEIPEYLPAPVGIR